MANTELTDTMTLDQTAAALGVSRRTLNGWLERNTVEAQQLRIDRKSYKRVLVCGRSVAALAELRRKWRAAR